MMEDPRTIGLCTHLLFIAKNIERVGDHATNIAETVYHMVTGSFMRLDRPKADVTSTTPIPHEPEMISDGFHDMKGSAEPTVLVVEDESALSTLLRYNLEREGYRVFEAQGRRRSAASRRRSQARSRAARLDAAAAFRHRSLPPAAQPRTYAQRAHRDADGARRGARPHPRTRHGRRRLHRQAVLDDRAARAASRGDAPRAPEPCRGRDDRRRDHHRPHIAPGAAREPRHPSWADRIPPARSAHAASGPRVLPRAAARLRSGARTSMSRPARSTCMSDACARR